MKTNWAWKSTLNTDLKFLDKAIEIQRQQSEQRLTDEINKLKQKLNISTSIVSKNLFSKLTNVLRRWTYKREINRKENNFDSEIRMSIKTLVDDYQIKSDRYQFISSEVNEAIKQSAQQPILELERKKRK